MVKECLRIGICLLVKLELRGGFREYGAQKRCATPAFRAIEDQNSYGLLPASNLAIWTE